MSVINRLDILPEGLPRPIDDGACDHLVGMSLPAISLAATRGGLINLTSLPSKSVIFMYPRTGHPDKLALTDDWNNIPGARGCTPQTCKYRDLYSEFEFLGYEIFGLSTQTTHYQQELVQRLVLPFPVLSDAELTLTRAMSLPTFIVAGQELIKRMAWVLHDGKIVKVFYPVFPPDQNASEVLAWLQSNYCDD